jgi:hypothetical protein
MQQMRIKELEHSYWLDDLEVFMMEGAARARDCNFGDLSVYLGSTEREELTRYGNQMRLPNSGKHL